MSNKLIIFGGNRKKGGVPTFSGKRSCLKRIKGYDTGQGEVEVGTLLLRDNKNNVIAKNVRLEESI